MASVIVQQLQSLAANGDELEEDAGIIWEAADRIEKLEARLAELQQPEGEQEGRVIEWLCKRGYTVTKGERK